MDETWMDENTTFDIPNFNCIATFKRQENRSAGVAIYQNKGDTANIITPYLNIQVANTSNISARISNVGDICSATCRMENGTEVVMVVVYISPNKKIQDIIIFLKTFLAEYNEGIAKWMGHKRYELPLILAGDFNINFASAESQPLLDELAEAFNLQLNNNPLESTTKYGTTIDAVFSRYLSKIESHTFVSYFSYHKPIVSFIECNSNE